MDAALTECVARFHAQPTRWALAITGGGVRLGGWLLGVPGGSRTILEIQTPYDTPATDAYLGRVPDSYCSPQAAILLAERALQRARWLAPRQPVVGFGCTASLRSDKPKRGAHRAHVATVGDVGTRVWSVVLEKDARTRDEEDDLVARLGLHALARGVGLAAPPVPIRPGEHIDVEETPSAEPLARFLADEGGTLCWLPDGRQMLGDMPLPRALVAGSFNPLHEAHVALVRAAAQHTGGPAAFELSVENVEKPPLDPAEVRWRAGQFRYRHTLWVSKAPRFVEKARLYQGVLFAVGADTAERLVQARFYGEGPDRMECALGEIRERGCRFLVAGRVDATGAFQTLDRLPIPPAFRDLFESLPESAFRFDVSSTALRAR